MPHAIPVPITRVREIRDPGIEVDAIITCFPGNDRVEYSLNILRVAPGQVFRIVVQAMFMRQKRRTSPSRQAVFYSNNHIVEGVPPGPGPYTGRSTPSEDSIYGVDDFEAMGAAHRIWHR